MDHTLIYILLTITAFIASTIDTLAGGGGLIILPTLLFCGMNPIQALGTNKLQSSIGELSATLHFMKKTRINYKVITMGFVYTILGSICGTVLLQVTPIKHLNKAIPFFLLGLLIYFILSLNRKNLFHNQTLNPDHKKFLLWHCCKSSIDIIFSI